MRQSTTTDAAAAAAAAIDKIAEEHAGLLQGYSTTDNKFILQTVIYNYI